MKIVFIRLSTDPAAPLITYVAVVAYELTNAPVAPGILKHDAIPIITKTMPMTYRSDTIHHVK
jgi:hypothetical protein